MNCGRYSEALVELFALIEHVVVTASRDETTEQQQRTRKLLRKYEKLVDTHAHKIVDLSPEETPASGKGLVIITYVVCFLLLPRDGGQVKAKFME